MKKILFVITMGVVLFSCGTVTVNEQDKCKQDSLRKCDSIHRCDSLRLIDSIAKCTYTVTPTVKR